MKKFTLLTLLLIFCLPTLWSMKTVPVMRPLNFKNPGTKRLVVIDKSKEFYYRSLPKQMLNVEVTGPTKICMKLVTKGDVKNIAFFVQIDSKLTKYELNKVKSDPKFTYFDPVYLNLEAGIHQISIKTLDRKTYFKLLKEEFKQIKEKRGLTVTSKNGSYSVMNAKSKKDYFIVSKSNPLIVKANYYGNITGFARQLMDDKKTASGLDIVVNGKLYNSIGLSNKTSKLYSLPNKKPISTGTKYTIPSIKPNDEIMIKPKDDKIVVIRMYLKKI